LAQAFPSFAANENHFWQYEFIAPLYRMNEGYFLWLPPCTPDWEKHR
jgi:hypothetical protein